MALLGRISAVLTANTQDFTRPLATATQDLRRFAQQARGLSFNLDDRALTRTLTRVQDFQRRIEEIRRASAASVGLGLPNPDRLLDKFRAFEDVGRPLTEVKNKVEQLSTAVQAELIPALSSLQADWRTLYSQIDTGATTFDAATGRINRLRDGVIAFGRAVAASQDLGKLASGLNANNAGASFFQPGAKEALQRSLELRNSAEKVPARFRGGVFADISVEAERNAEEIERAAARVAAAQLRIAREGQNPETITQRGIAQAELDQLTNRQTAINSAFQRQLSSSQIQQIVSPEAERQVDSLIERFAKLSAKLREGNDTRFENLIASVGRVVEQLNRGEVSARRAKVAIEALAGADFAKSFNSAGFDKATKSLKTDSEQALDEISKNFNAQRKNVIANVGALGLIGPDRTRRIGEINTQEDVARARVGFNSNVLESVSSLDTKTKQLDNAGLRSQFENIRKLAIEANSSLNAAFSAKPEDASAALDNYNLKLSALNKTLDNFEQKVSSAETAQKRFSQFLSISGSRSDKLGSSLTRFATDIAATRQLAGNLPASNVSGRAEIERRIEKDIQFAEKIANAQQRVSDNRRINEDERSRRRRLIDDTVARRRAESVDVLVDNSGGTITKQRAQSVMDRFAKNQGSISVAGAASAQLAVQQGLFAIDDLISSTGGLEYKLRAVGNNITQLGLLLGQSGVIPGLTATTGLMVGLGVVIGGQVVSALLRYVTAAQEASEVSKALGKSVERQASLLNEVNQGFSSIGDSLANAGFSEAARSAKEFADALEKVVKKQGELRKEQLVATDQGAISRRGLNDRLDARLENAGSPGVAIAVQRQRDELARLDRAAGDRLSRAQPSGGDIRNSLLAASRRLTEARGLSGGFRGARVDIEESLNSPAGLRNNLYLQGLRLAYPGARAVVPRPATPVLAAAAQRAGELAMSLPTGTSKKDRDAQVAGLNEIIESLKVKATDTVGGFPTVGGAAASRTIAELEQQRLQIITDSGIVEYFKAASEASKRLTAAQDSLTAAVEAGVPGAGAVRAGVDDLATQLEASTKRLNEAREKKSADPGTIDAAQKEVDAISATIAAREREALAIRNLLDSIDKERAAVESAASRISSSFDAIQQESESTVAAAKSRVSELTKEGVTGPVSRGQLDRARVQLDDQRRIRDELSVGIASARDAARRDPAVVAAEQRISEIDSLLKSDGVLRDNGQRDALARERATLQNQRDAAVTSLTDGDPRVTAIRARQDEAARLSKSIEDGVVDSLTPAKKAGLELSQSLRGIDAARTSGAIPAADATAANRRIIDDSMRQTAPAIFGMADQVMNAVVQGPSRASLQAMDISTAQGGSELSRLLRGDDSAKNQNLVELQKQSTALTELVTIARENGAPPGVFDN
jgi:hypothetical protein